VYEISEAANRAKAALEQQIEAKRTQHNNDNNTTWHNFKVSSSNFIRGFNENFVGEQEVPVIKEDKSYCADAAALMFSALPLAQARSAYIDFCHEHSFHPKTDCTEESMMHFIAGVMSTPAGTDAVNLLQTAIGTITDPLLQADCNAALAAFNFTELKRLVNTLPSRGQDAQNDCRKALQLLDTDYVQAVESLPETTDPERLYKATCRTELKQALTDAHRLWHNALPFPAPIVGDPALTIGDKVDRIQTILDFQ